MRRFLLFITILLIFSLFVFGQTSTKDNWIVEINGQKYYYSEFIAKFNMYIELTIPEDKRKEYSNDKNYKKHSLKILLMK